MSGILKRLTTFYSSSIGKKWIVALTGLALVGFILMHMIGNLLVFMGRDALNTYAQALHNLGHGIGVWVARLGLLAAFALHIICTIQLTRANRAARSHRYAVQKTQAASSGSRFMIVTGLLLVAFIIYHLIHFTISPDPDEKGYYDFAYHQSTGDLRHDVYGMVIAGFQNCWAVLFYLIAIAALCWHLSHGVSSVFQTLGLSSEKTAPLFDKLAWAFAALIFIGNATITLAILFGWDNPMGLFGK